MLCKECLQEGGGTRGDFFMLGMDDELRCSCGGELSLAKAIRQINIIKD